MATRYLQPLTIKMDPRVKASPADIALETKDELLIAADMKNGSKTAASVHQLQNDMKALAPQATGAVADAITALNKKTVAIAGEPPEAGGRGGRGGRGGGGGGGGGRGAAPLQDKQRSRKLAANSAHFTH